MLNSAYFTEWKHERARNNTFHNNRRDLMPFFPTKSALIGSIYMKSCHPAVENINLDVVVFQAMRSCVCPILTFRPIRFSVKYTPKKRRSLPCKCRISVLEMFLVNGNA